MLLHSALLTKKMRTSAWRGAGHWRVLCLSRRLSWQPTASGISLARGEFGSARERCYNGAHGSRRGSIVRPNAHDWKSCEGHTSAGSNPALSARFSFAAGSKRCACGVRFFGILQSSFFPPPLPRCIAVLQRAAAWPSVLWDRAALSARRKTYTGMALMRRLANMPPSTARSSVGK
jgi:hypothetical protein